MKKLLPSLFALVALATLALVPVARAQNQDSTIYQLHSDPLAQISGSQGGRMYRPTYAATMSVNPMLGIVHQVNGDSAVTATATLSCPNAGQGGQIMITVISATGSGTVTITFGTNFLPTATAAPTTGKSISVLWVSDGVAWHEVARSASAQ